MSLRKISCGAGLFSTVLFCFLPLLSAQAQDVDVPGSLRQTSWNPITPMPTARFGLAAAGGADGRIYGLGGGISINTPTVVPTVEAYDPETGLWNLVEPMPTARRFLAAVELDGKIYAVGGGPPFRNAAERYDPGTN